MMPARLSTEKLASPEIFLYDAHMGQVGTREAAERLGVTQARVGQLIRSGDLKAVAVGKTWVIDERSLKAFAKLQRRGPGRPPKKS